MPPVKALLASVALGLLAGPGVAELAYVTCQNGNALSVLDLDTGTEVARWEVPGKPAGVAVAPDGTVYTVSPDDKTLRHFDATGALLAEAVLDGGPIAVALDHARGRVFVSDWYTRRIFVLRAEGLAVERTLETGLEPAGLALSPDGRWLASADKDSNQVSLFDAGTLAVHARVSVGERPFGLRFAPDGRLFVGNVGTNDVSVIDPVAASVLASVPVGERPYGVGFARGRAFVTNQYADSVSVIDLATLAPLETLDVGEYPEGIDTTPDGATIVVANWFENTVTLIDAATMTVTGTIDTADGPRAFGDFIAKGLP